MNVHKLIFKYSIFFKKKEKKKNEQWKNID